MGLLLSLWAHHQEPAEPDLLNKIKNQLDAIFGLGPGLLVVLFGLVIVLIPLSVLGFYYFQRRKMEHRPEQDVEPEGARRSDSREYHGR